MRYLEAKVHGPYVHAGVASWWQAGPLVPTVLAALVLLLLWRVNVLERRVDSLDDHLAAIEIQVTHISDELKGH